MVDARDAGETSDGGSDPCPPSEEAMSRRVFCQKAGRFVVAIGAIELISLVPFLNGCAPDPNGPKTTLDTSAALAPEMAVCSASCTAACIASCTATCIASCTGGCTGCTASCTHSTGSSGCSMACKLACTQVCTFSTSGPNYCLGFF
jgi:hypothetical protein